MKKHIILLLLLCGLGLCGCGQNPVSEPPSEPPAAEDAGIPDGTAQEGVPGTGSGSDRISNNGENHGDNPSETGETTLEGAGLPGIGLRLSLQNVTPTSGDLVFEQYDRDAPSGELSFGNPFTIEALQPGESGNENDGKTGQNGKWEALPLQSGAVFTLPAYLIAPGSTVTRQTFWEDLYGGLAPGEYRMKKEVYESTSNGNKSYKMYAYFTING